MTRVLAVRKPTQREIHELEPLLEKDLTASAQRRAETILYYSLGLNGEQLAAALHVHPNTVYADLQAFEREGLACVLPLPVGGAPRQITDGQLNAIWHWAECSPRDVGLLDPRWTLANFREFLVKRQRVLKQISLEHLRRVLKKRHSLSARRPQTHQHGPATPRHLSPDSPGVSALARERGPGLFRCQARHGESLWRSAVEFYTARLAQVSKDARTVLSVCPV
jgi:transposase